MSAMFSIVMQSYLGSYPGAASQRPEKFRRAVESVLAQSLMDLELVVVSDGCPETVDIVAKYYIGSSRMRLCAIEKQPIWSGVPRNTGIRNATGEWITYLDTDDLLGVDHLAKLRSGLKSPPPNGWAYFDDWYWSAARQVFERRACDIDKLGSHGTSNIVHRADLGVWWPQDANRANYKHDHHFVAALKAKGEGVRIPAGEYYVAHDVLHTVDGKTGRSIAKQRFDV